MLQKFYHEFPWGTAGQGSRVITAAAQAAAMAWVPSLAWELPLLWTWTKKKKEERKKEIVSNNNFFTQHVSDIYPYIDVCSSGSCTLSVIPNGTSI